MAHNNDPMASVQMERYQGNPPRSSPLKSILHDIFTLRQSHSALEARVISIQCDANIPDERQGEPSFVVKPFTGENKKEPKKQSTRGRDDGSPILSSIPHQIV